MISDENLRKYVQKATDEVMLRALENQLLMFLKRRQETRPSELHEREWYGFSDYVAKRRGYDECT